MSQKAVALKYDTTKGAAPKVVAKGSGEVASKIITLAEESGVPLKQDADLVELLSKVELDQEVPSEMYKAVAEVFAFLYRVSKK